MGTLFHFMEMLPSHDAEARAAGGGDRQLEVFRPSGETRIDVRIGPLGEAHTGEGPSVSLDEAAAKELHEGLTRAMLYFGWDPN